MTGALSAGSRVELPQSDRDHRRGWISSRRYDLTFFIVSALSGPLLVVASTRIPYGLYLSIAATFWVAIPHYLSSFTFYLDDGNRAYYRTRWVAYYAGPPIILVSVAALRLGNMYTWVLATMFLWNIYHVAMQSAGILALYRRLNGGPSHEGALAKTAILAVNSAMALWFIERFPPVHDLLTTVSESLPNGLRYGCLIVAIVSLARLLLALAGRPRLPRPPEALFVATSLLLFHPFLWMENFEGATLAMLMGHFIQYLAIVWLLHHRRYSEPSGSLGQRLLGQVSGNPVRVLGAILVAGLVWYLINKTSRVTGLTTAWMILANSLALTHFYVDGLVWAFRDPHVRKTLGPYLTPPSHKIEV